MQNQLPLTLCPAESATANQGWIGQATQIDLSEPFAQVNQTPTTIPAIKDAQYPKAGRTLVICMDGTGDQFDNDNTNVVQLVACLKKDDPDQITYYQSGIGTYNGHGGLKKGFSAGLDMAVCICIIHFRLSRKSGGF
jgi:hypothetical protein